MSRTATVVLAGSLLSLTLNPMPLNAASWKKELIQKLSDTYKTTDRAFWNQENVKGGGTVMVMTQAGVTASLSTDSRYWTTGVKDGKILTEGTTSKSTTRVFRKGEKVFILDWKILEDVELPRDKSHSDIIRAIVLSVESSQRQEAGDTTERRYKGALDFQFPLKYLPTADFAELKKSINSALVSETEFQGTDATVTVKLGMTPEEVEAALGKPSKVIDLGGKKLYVYPDMKITFIEGRVSDVQ